MSLYNQNKFVLLPQLHDASSEEDPEGEYVGHERYRVKHIMLIKEMKLDSISENSALLPSAYQSSNGNEQQTDDTVSLSYHLIL